MMTRTQNPPVADSADASDEVVRCEVGVELTHAAGQPLQNVDALAATLRRFNSITRRPYR